MKSISYKNILDNKIYSGHVLTTVTNKKHNKTVNIVVISECNNKKIVDPFLKWIEDCQCINVNVKNRLNSKFLEKQNWDLVKCKFIGK